LEPGDCLDVIPRLDADGVVVDAVVTDPPYELKFMGKAWDGTGIAFRPETWAAVLSILRPGGYLLAFGGTRTYHRMVCAIEDAGFVIQDQIDWLYGSGFPKGRTQLKPAHEPICMAYKPGGKRALGIDECRILGQKRLMVNLDNDNESIFGMKSRSSYGEISDEGRWPANVIHDGSDEVMEAFAAYGESSGGRRLGGGKRPGGFGNVGAAKGDSVPVGPDYPDSGSVARFFYSAKADQEDRWGSKHPTVKPVELIRYLVKLITPPGGTFLDPFAGSGTAAVAALAEKRNAILVEQSEEYCADIRERIAHYKGEGSHSLAVKNRHRPGHPAGDLGL
jgi:site-specific DNA-methyltransferase (adenine-specific)